MAGIITEQQLIDASTDAETLEQVTSGDAESNVTSRLGRVYPTMARALYQVIQTGGFEPFQTESELLASVPTVPKKAAKAMDTRKIWYWGGSSWADTGLSEKDQAFTDSTLFSDSRLGLAVEYDKSNLLSTAIVVPNKYINTSGVVTSQFGTAYATMQVTAGSYYFKNYGASSVAGNFPIGFSTSANATSYTILTRTTVSPGVVRVDVTGSGYLAFDLKLNTANYIATLQVSSVLADVEKRALKINGSEILDAKLRDIAVTTDSIEAIGNLYNPATNKNDVYVRVTNSSIDTAAGAVLTQIKVKKGETYHITAPDLRGGIFAVALRADASMATGPTLGLATLTQITATHKTFTIPTDSLAEYALLTIKLPSLNLDIVNTIQITTLVSSHSSVMVNKIKGMSLSASTINKLTGKIITCIGDSITEHNFRALKNYHDFISEDVGGMTVYNRGISGSGFWNRLNVADTISEQPDIITLFWGVNDFGKDFPMGDFLSTDTNTLSGRMNYVVNALINKFPLAKIAILTPLPTKTQWGANATPNEQGFTLKDICDMEVRYAKHYSLPVLNQYETSNLPVWVQAANEYYFTADDGLHPPDGLHPNAAGQRVMADKIKVFLESL